jgi:hypothetical protein
MMAKRLCLLLPLCGAAAHDLSGLSGLSDGDGEYEAWARSLQSSAGPSSGPSTTTVPATTTMPPTTTTEFVYNRTNNTVTVPADADTTTFDVHMDFASVADLEEFGAASADLEAELALQMGSGAGSVTVEVVYKVNLEYSFAGEITQTECVTEVGDAMPSGAGVLDEDISCEVTIVGGGGGNATTTLMASNATTVAATTVAATTMATTTAASRRLSSHGGSSSTAEVEIDSEDASAVAGIAAGAEGITQMGGASVTASSPRFSAEMTVHVQNLQNAPTPSMIESAVATTSGVAVTVSAVEEQVDEEEDGPAAAPISTGNGASAVSLSFVAGGAALAAFAL